MVKFHPSMHPSIHASICPSVHPSIHPSSYLHRLSSSASLTAPAAMPSVETAVPSPAAVPSVEAAVPSAEAAVPSVGPFSHLPSIDQGRPREIGPVVEQTAAAQRDFLPRRDDDPKIQNLRATTFCAPLLLLETTEHIKPTQERSRQRSFSRKRNRSADEEAMTG